MYGIMLGAHIYEGSVSFFFFFFFLFYLLIYLYERSDPQPTKTCQIFIWGLELDSRV